MYNTSGLNNQANPNDTAPADLWNNVSEELGEAVPGAERVEERPPLLDGRQDRNFPQGPELDFSGLEGALVRLPRIPAELVLKHAGITANAYKDTNVQRASSGLSHEGKPLFILEDPNGNPWVMQAWSSQIDTSLTYDDLANLAPKLTLPDGWAYRVVNAKQDLKIVPVNGIATITQDDLGNVV